MTLVVSHYADAHIESDEQPDGDDSQTTSRRMRIPMEYQD